MNELLETTKIETLERIADALEGINDNLTKLSDCIGYIPPNHFQSKGYYFYELQEMLVQIKRNALI